MTMRHTQTSNETEVHLKIKKNKNACKLLPLPALYDSRPKFNMNLKNSIAISLLNRPRFLKRQKIFYIYFCCPSPYAFRDHNFQEEKICAISRQKVSIGTFIASTSRNKQRKNFSFCCGTYEFLCAPLLPLMRSRVYIYEQIDPYLYI